jgi:tetratricopeptide (TPR) repeat protein
MESQPRMQIICHYHFNISNERVDELVAAAKEGDPVAKHLLVIHKLSKRQTEAAKKITHQLKNESCALACANLGAFYYLDRNLSSAKKYLESSIELGVNNSYFALGEIYYSDMKLQDAERCFLNMINSPEEPLEEFKDIIGVEGVSSPYFDELYSIYRTVRLPKVAESYAYLGRFAQDRGNHELASQYYRGAIERGFEVKEPR